MSTLKNKIKVNLLASATLQ